MRLRGRGALVTGGLRGIGRAIVERFVEEGARVMASDLDADGPEVAGLPDGARYQRLDVTREADWADALAVFEREFGPLDILVNNAGASRSVSIADASIEDWRFVMDTNATSVFLGCRHAVVAMAGRGGAIVNIASARGLRAGAGQCAYSAAKAAVLSLTESVALHCGETGLAIRCNALCPGAVDTSFGIDAEFSEWGYQRLRPLHRLAGGMVDPERIAETASWLASAESAALNGAIVTADGGWTAG